MWILKNYRMVFIESSSTEVYDDELTTSTDSTCAPTTTKPNESAMTFSYISEGNCNS